MFAEILSLIGAKVYYIVNLVDLVKSFPTCIYLQNSASIQPRTGLSKFRVLKYALRNFNLSRHREDHVVGPPDGDLAHDEAD